ncbi:MAG: hypothetical protein K9M75_12065 [Phycisphaerae bacterium]|nr:hypothetical protein [Phycisphaerae bacterium]
MFKGNLSWSTNIVLLLIFTGSLVQAAVINVPGDYTIIQDAINASSPGDEILIAAGVYYQRGIKLDDKNITIRGANPADPYETVIDGEKIEERLLVTLGGDVSTIEGITFRNGVAPGGNGGAAAFLRGANTKSTFRNCIFTGNDAGTCHIGAVDCENGTFIFENCIFRKNKSGDTEYATSVGILGADVSFVQCLFEGDLIGPKVVYIQSTSEPAKASFINCTFANFSGGRFIYATCSTGTTTADLVNCVCDDSAPLKRSVAGAEVNLSKCLYPGATGDNIDSTPVFKNPATGDFRLKHDSPGIDAADSSTLFSAGITTDLNGLLRYVNYSGADDTGSGPYPYLDMGAYETAFDCSVAGDIDCNGKVDMLDLAIMTGNWLYGTESN